MSQLWEKIKVLLLVTLITALVWIFAETESLRSKELGLQVSFATEAGSDRLVTPEAGQAWRDRAQIVVSGSAAAIDAVETIARRPLTLVAGMEGVPLEAGEHRIDLRQALRAHPDLRSHGVTFTRVEPAEVRVFIEKLVTREIKVGVEAPGADLEGTPQANPGVATLTVPDSQAALLDERSTAVARVDPSLLGTLVPGRKETIPRVALELPAGIRPGGATKLVPGQVEVQLTLRNRTAVLELPSVPVQVRLAAVELGQWEIAIPQTDQYLTGVRVSGPSELIDQIARGELKITAFVPLSFEELERGIPSKEAVFCDLPTSLKFETANRLVRLAITKRQPAAAQPGAAAVPPAPAGGATP